MYVNCVYTALPSSSWTLKIEFASIGMLSLVAKLITLALGMVSPCVRGPPWIVGDSGAYCRLLKNSGSVTKSAALKSSGVQCRSKTFTPDPPNPPDGAHGCSPFLSTTSGENLKVHLLLVGMIAEMTFAPVPKSCGTMTIAGPRKSNGLGSPSAGSCWSPDGSQ